ncbi:MAG: MFS transporter [Gammaproteobacteria bacterium]|nr:MAG: MFS transporter [Gammaproteobacteria bacterium]
MQLSENIRQYLIITGNYWAFTLTDGALRMLVVLYFYELGYTPIAIASLFLFYEFFGVVTNLFGGWLGARWGLNRTMNIGLALQIVALALLLVPTAWLTVAWVMFAQALSGIAKDLNKMSAKSAIKTLVPKSDTHHGHENQLYRWVALLTGSKNALKGLGFFLGGLLLTWLGFRGAVFAMATMLTAVWFVSLLTLKSELGKAKYKPKFKHLFAKNQSINYLSAARFFLFGARDIWFVIAAPIALASYFGWSHTRVGAFFAIWIIFYGIVQANTPKLLKQSQHPATPKSALLWVVILLGITALLSITQWLAPQWAWGLVIGLFIFAGVFALNSAIHSYLIVSYADADGTSMDVGFYYMANAAGRLAGTVLSGALFQSGGLLACLLGSVVFLAAGTLLTGLLKKVTTVTSRKNI